MTKKTELMHYLDENPILETLGREEGIPWVWVCGGALATILVMIACMFLIIAGQGLVAHFPKTIVTFSDESGKTIGYGIPYRKTENEQELVYAANRDAGGQEFYYVKDAQISPEKNPDVWYFERFEWGPFIGFPSKLVSIENQIPVTLDNPTRDQVKVFLEKAHERFLSIRAFEEKELQPVNRKLEELRLTRRKLDVKNAALAEIAAVDNQTTALSAEHAQRSAALGELINADKNYTMTLKTYDGVEKEIVASQVTRAFQPNQMNIFSRFKIYIVRIWEFLSQEPREANTAGGVFPAIFGTVAMTLLMSIAVLPLGVLTAVYIREIAKQGFIVSFVRIAVGNLAGVPSIVYGIFGLGFFCYSIGGSIDQLFYSERLPNPTFGTGGILWASLTLALLTVPVVIVSTEEALSAVPRTLREASYGCGATRLQTLFRIVLPKAMPGIMTGLILAMARGAGEVAPLLMTGVVKLAPTLPIDTQFPFVHLERSFMHLGFHIYDLGFQSRSTEISRPMVFASTLLLIALVLVLNFFAIKLRTMLRRRFEGRGAF